jgi:hypothetical protein
VITISIMPPFTYPNLSLYGHGVITVFRDLQIFLHPTNGNVTHVLHAMSSSVRVSAMVMISTVICCHPKTSDAGATFGALYSRIEGSLPEQDAKVCCRCYCEAMVSPRPTCEGELCSEISVTSGPHPQHSSSHVKQTSCEKI